MKNNSLLIWMIIFCFACADEEAPKAKFEGIIMKTSSGNPAGTLGDNDLNDWQEDDSWSEREYALLAYEDTVSLENTAESDVSIFVYPNPTSDYFTFRYQASNRVKFKMVLVDESFNVLEKLSSSGEFISFSFDVEKYFSEKGPEVLKAQSFGPGTFFTDQYASGQILRVYYTFSAEDALNFYKGHGDILICRDADKVEDCYPY